MTRLSTEIWISAYLKHLSMANIPAYVMRRGDNVAGAILIKVNTLNGQAAVFSQTYDILSDCRSWSAGETGAEEEIDAMLTRQTARDPDLWVIEIESPNAVTLLEMMG